MSAYNSLSRVLLISSLGILTACCPNPERLAKGLPATGLLGGFIDSLHQRNTPTPSANTKSSGKTTMNVDESTKVMPRPVPPPPLKAIPQDDQALHIAISKGYLSGLPDEQNWRRRFQVKVDGTAIWEGELAFGDSKGPSKPEVCWLPAPILTPRGPHDFVIVDLTTKSEIAAAYACAAPQCWGVVTYAKEKNKLDLIQFLDEEPKF